MNAKWLVAASVVVCGFAACGDDGPDDPRTLQGVPGDDGAGTAVPFGKLTVTLGADGGELVGSGPGFDGFRFVVPAGALAQDTEITVELALDPTPLPELATAIGPQYRVSPSTLTLTTPASVTLPFDADLRQQGDATDEECKAWTRTDGDWVGIDQTSSTPTSVTVPMSQGGVIGAGLFIKSLPTTCLNCQPAPAPTCLSGGNLCMEKVGTQHVTMSSKRTWYHKGVIYWVTVPAVDSYAIAGFDTLTRSAVPTTSALANVPLTSHMGDVVVDKKGSKWLGFNLLGNVEFPVSGQPIRFDAGSSLRAHGVVLDRQTGAAIRLRTRPLGTLDSITGVSENTLFGLGSAGPVANIVSVAPGVTLSTPIALALTGSSWGTSAIVGTTVEGVQLTRATRCGASAMAFMNGPISHPRKNRWGTFCQNERDEMFLQVFDGTSGSPSLTREAPIDRTVLDGAIGVVLDRDDNWWLAHSNKAQLTQVRTDGGIVTYPLTTATAGTSTYNQMLARGLAYEPSSETLFLVTRGTSSRGDIYKVSNLP